MRMFLKILILVLMIIYIASPLDAAPGPFDDLIVLLLGVAAQKGMARIKCNDDNIVDEQ